MSSTNHVEFIEPLLKNIFDIADISKQKQNKKELENYIKQNIDKNREKESLSEIVTAISKILFDTSKQFRNKLITGDLSIFFNILSIIKTFDPQSDTVFILYIPMFVLLKELDSLKIINFCNSLISDIKNNTNIVFKHFNDFFGVMIYLRTNQKFEVRATANELDSLLNSTLSHASKTRGTVDFNSNFDMKDFLQKLFHKLPSHNPTIKLFVISWINVIEKLTQSKLILLLPEILPKLFGMLGEKIKEVTESAEKCLISLQENFQLYYEEYFTNHKDLVEQILILILNQCSSPKEEARKAALNWINKLLEKFNNLATSNSEFIPLNKDDHSHSSSSLPQTHVNDNNNTDMNIISSPQKKKMKSSFSNDNSNNANNNSSSNIKPSIPKPPIFTGSVTNLQNIMELKNNRQASTLNVNNILKYLPNFLIAKLLEVIITFTNCPEKSIEKTSNLLKQFINHIPNNSPAFDVHALEETICSTIDNKTEINLDNVLCWYELLYNKFKDEMFSDINKFIKSYVKLLPETNEAKITLMITFLCSLVKYNEKNIEPVITILTEQFHKSSKLVTSSYASKIIKILCENLGVVKVFRQFAETLLKIKDISFLQNFLKKLNGYLHEEKVLKEVKEYLTQFKSNEEVKEFFLKMFSVLCYTPISALMFCIIAGYFELSFNVLLNFGNVTLGGDYVAQFGIIINYIENHIANDLRMKLLEPLNNIDLVRTLYGILLILPQGVEYDMLSNRMKGIETLIEMSYDDYYREEDEVEKEGDDNKKVIEELLICFNNTQMEIKRAMNEKEGV